MLCVESVFSSSQQTPRSCRKHGIATGTGSALAGRCGWRVFLCAGEHFGVVDVVDLGIGIDVDQDSFTGLAFSLVSFFHWSLWFSLAPLLPNGPKGDTGTIISNRSFKLWINLSDDRGRRCVLLWWLGLASSLALSVPMRFPPPFNPQKPNRTGLNASWRGRRRNGVRQEVIKEQPMITLQS